ncbi:unnamed protein product [Ilex paraguariensis]|uniref:Uncharacterized protein n=1 Tax=Ilex paraguariensis TaxID=185542 RepID=A0ABC8TZ61_9AQUA
MDMVIDVAEITNVFISDSVLKVELPHPLDVGIGEEPNPDEIDDNEPNGENDDRDANRNEVDDVNGDKHTGGGGENDDNFMVSVLR